MSDLDKPLLIPRTTLIKRLEEHLAEKEAKRAEAEAAVAATRQKFLDAIASLSPDELGNLVGSYLYGTFESKAEWLKKQVEKKTFVSPESKPTPVEDTLAKQVRVMKMATNKEIEIFPSDSVYHLL